MTKCGASDGSRSLHRLVRSFLCGLRLGNLFFPPSRRLPKIAYPRTFGEVKGAAARTAGIEACANAGFHPSCLRVAVTSALDPPCAAGSARQLLKPQIDFRVG